jgi:hypothetical protein
MWRVAKSRVKELVHETDGVEIVEAAFVLPIVFMFLFGIIWFALAFNLYSTVNVAAREGARAAARATCATCAAPAGKWGSTNFPDNQGVEDAVTAVLQGSRAPTSKIIAYTPFEFATPTFCDPPLPAGSCSFSTNNVRICRFVRLNPGSAPQQCGTVVSFQYPFGLLLPFPSYPTFSTKQVIISASGESLIQN